MREELLAATSQRTTIWSVVYNLQSGRILVASGRDYDDLHEFHLPMKPTVALRSPNIPIPQDNK